MYGTKANWLSFGALGDVAVMFAPLTRIDVRSGKVPRKTRAPSVPIKFWIKMEMFGNVVKDKSLLLSISSAAPLRSDTFTIVTVTFAAAGLAWTIAATLRLIITFPCATTFTNATLVQDALTVSFATRVELVTMHGMMAIAGWTTASIIKIMERCLFM